jgi:hypothetical protein
MNWLRSRARSGVRLALFALLLQMSLAFGHLHPDDLGIPPIGIVAPARVTSNAGQAQPQPATEAYCPICATIALLATGRTSAPPALVIPEPVQPVWRAAMPVEMPPVKITLSFRARAPPAA